MRYELVEIKKIDSYEALNEIVYDIEVEQDHSFCVDNNIIVHNSVCETRIKTGFGVPQFTAIQECVKSGVPIIADGGIREPGDVCKAIAIGAKFVMCGQIFAASKESPGEITEVKKYEISKRHYARDGWGEPIPMVVYTTDKYKIYRGMASREAYEDFFGQEMPDHKTSEGVEIKAPYKGPIEPIIKDIIGGLRSALTYCGAHNISEFQRRVEFIEITQAGQIESTAHYGK